MREFRWLMHLRVINMGRFGSLLKRMISENHLSPSLIRRYPVVDELGVREAYRLWASTYATETVTCSLDEELARTMLRGLPQTRLLDAGCGIGRRIQNIPNAIGMDLIPGTLAGGRAHNVVIGDIRAMPFESNCFDMIWCRLVLSYLPDPLLAYGEIFRVCRPGGYVFITDFHPDAAAAWQHRTLTDEAGPVHAIEHFVHGDHMQLAVEAGLSFVAHCDGAVGPSVRDFYIRGLGLKAYKRDVSLKLVVAFLFRKPVV
jgi:malonyl-CoA O-methyltransferase